MSMSYTAAQPVSSIRTLWKGVFGWERRQQLARWITGEQDEHWTRVVMNAETRRLVDALPLREFNALEISGTAWSSLPFASYKSVAFPDFDICKDRLDERFDIIIAEQVFEHLLWPYRATRNVFEMLKPGGYFLISTPFMLRVHECPVDCSRWTETGLRHLLAECGFPLEDVRTGAWGNRACVEGNLREFVPYKRRFHSLENDPLYPIHVWALAHRASQGNQVAST